MHGYVKNTGSVLAPIVAHVTANLLALFATKYQVFDRMMADIRVIGMVTVGAATIAAIIYLQIKQLMKNRRDIVRTKKYLNKNVTKVLQNTKYTLK